MDLQNVFRVIRKWLLLIILVPVLTVMVTGYYFYQIAQPEYTSFAKILVFKQQNDEVLTGSDLGTSSSIINDFCVIVTSTPVLQDAAASMEIERADGQKQQVSLSDLKACNISVSKGTDNRIVTVSVTSKNASLAYNTVDAVVHSATIYARDYLQTDNITVIEPATAARQSGPESFRNTVIGGVAGFVIAIIFVLMIEFLNTTIRDAEEVEKLLELPVLAKIPRYEK
ncbi:MAG: Wzz/FepE/Etk N-terminal domain-containing protein [Eubacteriales bacterium]|nr:Wzz/FepE/Etk N-terminal domain-containing protein [Eubacteriales bacterium]